MRLITDLDALIADTEPDDLVLPVITMRVGFDFNSAGKRFIQAVKDAASTGAKSTGGLRALDVSLRAANSEIGARKLTFYFVELHGTYEEIAERVLGFLPMDKVTVGQYRIEIRPDNHLHVAATGINTWLVCEGELPEPVNRLPPNPPGTPGTPVVRKLQIAA